MAPEEIIKSAIGLVVTGLSSVVATVAWLSRTLAKHEARIEENTRDIGDIKDTHRRFEDRIYNTLSDIQSDIKKLIARHGGDPQ